MKVAIVIVVTAVIAHILLTKIKNHKKSGTTVENSRNGKIKGVLLVRKDLKMTPGKVAAQAMHAAYSAGMEANRKKSMSLWNSGCPTKLALKVSSKEEMKDITDKCISQNIPVFKIFDAGRTQVEPNSWTVSFIGPCYESEIDSITGHLSLY